MTNDIGNYARHAQYWDWGGHDRSDEHEYWYKYAAEYGENVLIPMCALGEVGTYMAERGMNVTAFDVTPEMINEGKKRFGNIAGLRFYDGDVRDFRFDIKPADFCFCTDFGHIHTMEEIKKALVCINNHLRYGGCLIIKTGLRILNDESNYYPKQTFYPLKQVYPNLKVWKVGDSRNDSDTGRFYISQKFFAEDENGNVDSFDHAFYLQSYYRDEWLAAFKECGFDIVKETEDSGYYTFELVKSTEVKERYSPTISFDYLQVPIYTYENVSLYNDKINLEQPNSGYSQFYRFDINADGNWVGGIHVLIGYSIRIHYCGHIGYEINEQYRNRGYVTKACLALIPFLRKCGFKQVLITNDENNIASRRVCEKIGAELIEIVDTPKWTGMYKDGQRRTCIYEWKIQSDVTEINLKHVKINLENDRDYVFERHCRINYACDTPWARKIPYEQYRANWFAWENQQDGFLSALCDSMKDERSIAEIIKTESDEIVGYLWVAFYGDDPNFIFADVQDIYIEESYRNKGIASYLMNYAEQSAKRNGAKVIRSGTGCENIASQSMHGKLGYYQYRMEYEKVLED